MLGYNKRQDKNQAEIIKHLEKKLHLSVADLSHVGGGVGDILVGFKGVNYMFEIKTDEGKLNKKQKLFHATWAGSIHTVHSIDEILEVINVRK